MNLKDLGYTENIEQHRKELGLDSFELGRVVLEHKERYVVKTTSGEYDAELMGNLRFTAESRYDFPAVGDWVAFMEYDQDKALIHAIYPRYSTIERKAVGKLGQVQIIATNIDFGLIVQAVDRDFNLNRIERYLTICNSSGVKPVIVLSKIDLINDSELEEIINLVAERVVDVPVLCVSSESIGYSQLHEFIQQGKTYCLLGSSGVGKSTLLNGLQGKEEMKTGEISSAVKKGKHTTSHRELIVLNNGGILIDNPGMREVGITGGSSGLDTTYDKIAHFATDCRFKDCNHVNDVGCAVIEGVENGEIENSYYQNFLKLQKESAHFESSVQEKRKKDKDFGKMIKNMKKSQKRNK